VVLSALSEASVKRLGFQSVAGRTCCGEADSGQIRHVDQVHVLIGRFLFGANHDANSA
jgi:hypothetical protein